MEFVMLNMVGLKKTRKVFWFFFNSPMKDCEEFHDLINILIIELFL